MFYIHVAFGKTIVNTFYQTSKQYLHTLPPNHSVYILGVIKQWHRCSAFAETTCIFKRLFIKRKRASISMSIIIKIER